MLACCSDQGFPPLTAAVGLVDKPWNTAIAFLPPSSTSDGGNGAAAGASGDAAAGGSGDAPGAAGTRLLVGTGYHKVRLYDSAAGKRPQMELSWSEGRITALALEPDGEWCLCLLQILDIVAGLQQRGPRHSAGA